MSEPAPVTSAVTPALFIGHGSPMNALERNAITERWRAIGEAMPRPRAIVAISAHWWIGATALTAMRAPRTIHDFYGFPPELGAFSYPAPGDPDLAAEIAEAVRPEIAGLDHDQWGLDHGTWSILAHMFPQANVPVLQLSLNGHKPSEWHVALGRRLAPLREQGVLFLASGNIVHNLRAMDWRMPDTAYAWTHRFDDAVERQLADDPAAILRVAGHPDFAKAAPTPDHFVPLLYLAGLADAAGERPSLLIKNNMMGSVSMASYALGLDLTTASAGAQVGGAATIPAGVPADQSNI
jgi:4,5-DOPA dioxygenase extradiol